MFFLEKGILKTNYSHDELIDDIQSDEYTRNLLENGPKCENMIVQIVDLSNICDKFLAIHLFDGQGIIISLIDYNLAEKMEQDSKKASKNIEIKETYKLHIGSIIKMKIFEIKELADLIVFFNLELYYELDKMDEIDRKKKIFFLKDFQILGFQLKTAYKDSDNLNTACAQENFTKKEYSTSIIKSENAFDEDEIQIIDYIPNRMKVNEETKVFTPLDRLGMVKKRCVEVMGVILEIEQCAKEQETQTININVRRFKLIDMTRTIISVALWGKEADEFNFKIGTIVMLNNCTLTNFRGVSLSVHKSTFLTEVHKQTTHRLGRKLFKWWNEYSLELEKNNKKKRKALIQSDRIEKEENKKKCPNSIPNSETST